MHVEETLEREVMKLKRSLVSDKLLIEVRRSHILEDALKEGHKRKFQPEKIFKVFCC